MADVLARIVARKRAELGAGIGAGLPDPEPTKRSLAAALARPGARFVMEVKRASPSGHRARHSVETALAAYRHVADALSVLTDGPDFGGSLDDLARARAVFDGPILAKDFIVDPVQVAAFRRAGADAVLAMLSVLDDEGARAVIAEARRFGMDAIVEVHDEAELDRALGLDAQIIGINNRDLKTLAIDLATTERLAPRIPAGVIAIAESGIASRGDVARLAPYADAFLIGSSLMAADDIAEAARALVFGRVKLCGMTRADDIEVAARAGATHIGLIVVPGTPRAVTMTEARPLADEVRACGIKPVGVFRDAPPDTVIVAARELELGIVQLHGREDEAEIVAIRDALPGVEIWGLCGVENDAVAPPRGGIDRSVFDTMAGGISGGSGLGYARGLLAGRADLAGGVVSGGIDAANAREALVLGAYGIDACSGIEAEPGRKDHDAIAALMAACRAECRKGTA